MAEDRDAFIDTIAQLPGVGDAKAKALWEAGYRSIEEVAAASAEDLSEDVDGVGPTLAESILEGLEDLEAPEEEDEAAEEDEAPEQEDEEEAPEPEAGDEDELIETVSQLPGVGEAKAQALWEAGYRSIQQVQEASPDELADDVQGVGPKLAEAILQGLEDLEAPEPEPEVEVAEEEDEDEAEIVEEEAYIAKPKPDLDEDTQHALQLRNAMNGARPRFVRRNWWQFARFDKDHSWRKPRGQHSKHREDRKQAPNRVKVGYRGPKKARDLHPSGFEEILVHNPSMLDDIDPDTQAARIASAVGKRKRILIIEKAQDMGIHVLNPGGID